MWNKRFKYSLQNKDIDKYQKCFSIWQFSQNWLLNAHLNNKGIKSFDDFLFVKTSE